MADERTKMAVDVNSAATSQEGVVDRARKTGGKSPRKKRDRVAELAAVQGRVDVAVNLLVRCSGDMAEATLRELVAVAVETLRGPLE